MSWDYKGVAWNPALEDGSGQGSESLPKRSVSGLTLQGSIRAKQVRRERMAMGWRGDNRRKVTEVKSGLGCSTSDLAWLNQWDLGLI